MKEGKSSKTAEQMAISRAIESSKPEGERICYDPYAKDFLGPKYALPIYNRIMRRIAVYVIERLFPGHHYYVVTRTRYIDDTVNACLDPTLKQLVVLGAGFDSRAYRFPALKNKRVFEVDHPDTQETKKGKVFKIFNSLPDNVTYVTVDFSRENPGDKLMRSGYNNGMKSIFIWEGTTPYISVEAVDETLGFVSSNSGKNSVIIFDYILKSVLDGTCEFQGARNEFEKMAKTTEPLIFGIEADKIVSFLENRGFHNIKDVGSDYLRKTYFSQKYQMKRRIKPWWRITRATVGI
jgi:methyltransferase (TIGR00027 family)